MNIKDKFYINNYYLNNPVKFYTNPKKIRDFFIGGIELLKIVLAKFGMLKWSFNERIIERPFVFHNLPDSGRVLDIGCSDSIMPIEIASLGYETYGNDLKNYPFKHPRFKFIPGDAMKLPFQENFLDAVTCISVLEHVGLSKDYSGSGKKRKDLLLMEKIRKMLKKKGVLILTIPFGTKRILANQHTRIYDSQELKLISRGFRIKKTQCFYQKDENWFQTSSDFLEKITSSSSKETVAMFVLEKM